MSTIASCLLSLALISKHAEPFLISLLERQCHDLLDLLSKYDYLGFTVKNELLDTCNFSPSAIGLFCISVDAEDASLMLEFRDAKFIFGLLSNWPYDIWELSRVLRDVVRLIADFSFTVVTRRRWDFIDNFWRFCLLHSFDV